MNEKEYIHDPIAAGKALKDHMNNMSKLKISELGISVFDKDGNGKPLKMIMQELKRSQEAVYNLVLASGTDTSNIKDDIYNRFYKGMGIEKDE